MRVDRFLTLHLFSPLGRIRKPPEKLRIPILMYHSISEHEEKGVNGYYKINTFPKVFSEHMKYLYENGYSVIGLTQAGKMITSPPAPKANDSVIPSVYHSCRSSFEDSNIRPGKYAVLTFDDGYRDFYTHAFPILKRYGFAATVFLPTSFIENRKLSIRKQEHLNWDEVRELQKEGIVFGAHTVTHPRLNILKGNEIEYEVKKSKEVIENKIGQHVKSFSYPYAFPEEDKGFVRILRTLLRSGGYENGVTTRIGTIHTTDDIYFLKRIPLNSEDDVSFFRVKLEGDYDWVYGPQVFSKFLRKQLSFSTNSRYTGNIE